jgi:hypothetical protein
MRISGSIRNMGRFQAHVEKARFGWRSSSESNSASKPLSCELPTEHVLGATLPLELPAQTGQEFTVVDLGGVDLGLSVALHDRRSVSLAFHTATGKKARAMIRYSRK